jgi:hypothetical protein
MPIEIRELVIKMTVDNSGSLSSDQMTSEALTESLNEIKEDIIRECTDRILKQLSSNKER